MRAKVSSSKTRCCYFSLENVAFFLLNAFTSSLSKEDKPKKVIFQDQLSPQEYQRVKN